MTTLSGAQPLGLDFIGDIHGNLPALEALGRALGYETQNGWRHVDGRLPVFMGDLIDRGPYSLETARLVADLVADRRAFCILGNHEYNLCAWEAGLPGWEKPKRSNGPTCADLRARPADWAPALALFRSLPIALEIDGVRAIHASWHLPSMAALPPTPAPTAAGHDPFARLQAAVVVDSPFAGRGMRDGFVASGRGEPDSPHEILIKGHEAPADEPFPDADGHLRHEVRITWWRQPNGDTATDLPIVVGHYWNLPPFGDAPTWAPPWPSGHPNLRAWWKESVASVRPEGRAAWTSNHVCVDFNGMTRAMGDRACAGAMRWPEREIVWASAPVDARPGFALG